MRKRNPIIFVLLIVLLLAGKVDAAGSRDHLFFQGLVQDATNTPVNGTLNLTFRLYDVSTGGSALWEETQSLSFVNGLYSAELGSVTNFPSDLFEHESLFLGVQIEGDSELSPRSGLFSVPFAQQCEVAVTAQSLANNIVTSANIVPGSVTAANIAAGAIGSAELASTSVTPGTYTLATITVDADGRITSAANGVAGPVGAITGVVAGTGINVTGAGTVTVSLANDGITATQIADSAVTSAKIQDGTITNTDINASANIDWAKINKTGAVAGDIGAAPTSHTHPATDITGTLTDAQIPNNITIDLAATATTLAANGANCAAGSYPLGVNASGAVEGCTVAATGSVTSVSTGTGLTGGPIITAGTVSLDYSATLASNPTLAANQSEFASTGIIFEGATVDTNEGLLTVADPTADRTWTLPNVSGTLITTGDTGSVTATMIADASVSGGTAGKIEDNTITDADINASAAIAGTKVNPSFGSQAVTTSGNISTTGSGNITAGGDIAATGGFKMMIGPFEETNAAASTTNRDWDIASEGLGITKGMVVAWAGSVMGVSVSCNADATAGTLTVEPTIITISGNTETVTGAGLTATLTATTGTQDKTAFATQAKDLDTFSAGARIGCRGTTNSTWAPTSNDCVCLVFIEM